MSGRSRPRTSFGATSTSSRLTVPGRLSCWDTFHQVPRPADNSPNSCSVSDSDVVKTMQLQFYIGLHTTVCFRLNEDDHIDDAKSSWLHTIRLDRVEHHHPVEFIRFCGQIPFQVVQHYEFGIPEVTADCFCECDSNADACNAATHQFTTCHADSSVSLPRR